MLRLLHTADVHLGARHEDLGEAAAALRELQHAGFGSAVDLALAERSDIVLVAGDLFDTNAASRRTVERAASELARLVAARIHVVLLPGGHDAYERWSVYRAYDLPALAGSDADDDLVTVLTPERPWVHLARLDVVVHGPVDPARRGKGPFGDLATSPAPAATWRIGMLHSAVGDTEADGLVAAGALEASGLDYIALGHVHAAEVHRAGGVTWGYSGASERVAVEQDGPGTVLLVTLDAQAGAKKVTVEERTTGRAHYQLLEVDAETLGSEAALENQLRALADPDLVLDLHLTGTRPDVLEVDPPAVEDALRTAFLDLRVADHSRPPLTAGQLPPAETIAGAFLRSVEGRVADLEAASSAGADDEADELREVLRLGRRLLAGREVAP